MPRLSFDGPEGPESLEIGINLKTGALWLTLAEARHIQRVADLTAEQLRDRVFLNETTDPVALTALVQVLWKRQGRIVAFEDVDFNLGSLRFEELPDEAAEAERIAASEAAEAAPAADAADPTPTLSGAVPTEV